MRLRVERDDREPVAILARAPRVSALVVTACEASGDAADLDPEAAATTAREARPDLDVRAVPDPDDAVAAARALADREGDVLILVGNGLGARLAR